MLRILIQILLRIYNGQSREILIRMESGISRTLQINSRAGFTLTFKSRAFLYKETFTRFYKPNSYFYKFDVYTEMSENTPELLKIALSDKITFKISAIKEDLFPDKEWDKRMRLYIDAAIDKAKKELSKRNISH